MSVIWHPCLKLLDIISILFLQSLYWVLTILTDRFSTLDQDASSISTQLQIIAHCSYNLYETLSPMRLGGLEFSSHCDRGNCLVLLHLSTLNCDAASQSSNQLKAPFSGRTNWAGIAPGKLCTSRARCTISAFPAPNATIPTFAALQKMILIVGTDQQYGVCIPWCSAKHLSFIKANDILECHVLRFVSL